jgi:hypothetical protein
MQKRETEKSDSKQEKLYRVVVRCSFIGKKAESRLVGYVSKGSSSEKKSGE